VALRNKTFVAVVIVNLAVLVVLAIYMPYLMISPGKLIDAHAELATDCFACHTPFLGSRPAKCIQCHKVAEIGIKTTTGLSVSKEKKNVAFHQKLTEDNCIGCHSDHRGVQAFRPIGQFSHQLIEPAVRAQCDGCHSRPGDALHRKIKGNCRECHTEQGWLPATFDHEQYFRFDKHHTTECETCHVDSDYSSYTCYGCHEHSRSEIREEHVEEGIYDYENCVECHRSGDEEEAEYLWRKKRGRQGETEKDERRSYRREHDEDERHDDD
jgi:hypothetical protein